MEDGINSYEVSNPVFNTAKMTSFFLAEAGNRYAKKIIDATGFDKQLAYSSESDKELMVKPNAIGQCVRYEGVNYLVRKAGNKNILDLACGFSPRGLELTEEGYNYIGGDLQMVVPVIGPVIRDMAGDRKDRIRYSVVDVTNRDSCIAAAEGLDGPVTIITEGVLPYLNSSEKELLFENIAEILNRHGGCYILPDCNANDYALKFIVACIGEEAAMESVKRIQAEYASKGDSDTVTNMADLFGEAKELMIKAHLKPEIRPYFPESEEFSALGLVEESRRSDVRKVAAQGITILATLDETALNGDDGQRSSEKKTVIRHEVTDSIIHFILSGRIDSLNAPQFVDEYQSIEDRASYDEVRIDMKDLAYISSAGLRVIMMIKKDNMGREIVLSHVCEEVKEIFATTGFDSIVEMEDQY